jgi:O-antigen/teichoic acid export membrane protein
MNARPAATPAPWRAWLHRGGEEGRALFAGTLAVGALRIGAAVAAIALTIVLARLLGPTAFGAYALAFAVAAMATWPLLQGLPTLVLREVGAHGEAAKAPILALLRFADRLVLGVGVALALAVVALHELAPGLALAADLPLALAALALPLATVATLVRGAVLRGLGRPSAGQWPDLLARPLVFLGMLALAWAATRGDASRAMAMHVAAALVALALADGLLQRARSLSGTGAMDAGRWLRSLLPLSTVAGMQLLNSQIDLLALGVLAGAREAGVYKVASVLALQVSFALTVVNAVAAPRFAALYRAGRIAELVRLNRFAAALAFAGGAVVACVLVGAGARLVALAVGEGYAGAWLPMVVLCVAHLATLWAGTTNVLLNMIGHERDVLACAAASALANLALNAVLVPRFGLLGAACASAVALILWRVLLAARLRKRLGEAEAPDGTGAEGTA